MQNSLDNKTIGFIGAGHMSGALVGGLVASGACAPDHILVSNRGQDKLNAFCQRYGVQAATDNESVVRDSDIVVLSVKPQVMHAVLQPLSELFQQQQPLVISVAAGLRCEAFLDWLGADTQLVRSMPNMPSVIREGVTGLYAPPSLSDEQREFATSVFASVGSVSWVEDEGHLDLVTALSGSGPAYFMLVIQSLIEAATAAGLGEDVAIQLAVQTARGTAGMITRSEKPLPQMIEDMLLPGGTTEQGIATLRMLNLPDSLTAAFSAASRRAAQIADEFSTQHKQQS